MHRGPALAPRRTRYRHVESRCEVVQVSVEQVPGHSSAAFTLTVYDPAHASETALHLTDRLKIDVSAGNFSGFTGLVVQEEQLTEWLGG